MSYEVNLPFQRGSTYYAEADSGDISATDVQSLALEGKCYHVPDDVHGTGLTVTLRVVRNEIGSAITVVRGVGYAFTAGKVLRGVSGAVGDGAFGRIIDDKYAVGQSIADDDLFYVVEKGPVYGRSNAAYSAGDALAFTATGEQDTATEGEFVIGVADVAATGADQNQRIIVGGTDLTLAAA